MIQIREPFESYVGHDPYIFISYAHRDKEKVYPCLEFLNNQNINIWYDEGIPPSAEWVEEIAQAIKKSCLFVVFMSPHALESRYVVNEINYAFSLNKKKHPDNLSGRNHAFRWIIPLPATFSVS